MFVYKLSGCGLESRYGHLRSPMFTKTWDPTVWICAAQKENIVHIEKTKGKKEKEETKFSKAEAVQVNARKIESQIKSNKEHTHNIAYKKIKLEVNKI